MIRKSYRYLPAGFSALFLLVLLFTASNLISAGGPPGPDYSPDTNRLFWFIQTSDTHIGAPGSQDSDNLSWLVSEAKNVIAPEFIIVSGDLTDSTNGNIFGYPNGPYQAEWDEYKSILTGKVDKTNYYDIPGNHDAYNDRYFAYYLANSVQGRATDRTQVSFVKDLGFGKYHFMGVNTADNTGDGFSVFWPYGDYAGLDTNELSFINTKMAENSDSNLTLVFGHHPLFATGNSQDTYVYYGLSEFLTLMRGSYSALYGYGHTHEFSEAFFIPDPPTYGGFFYFNVASLGKSDDNQYTIMAIDCNGISSKTLTVKSWPAVLITAPLDDNLGGMNPYGYKVPAGTSNPIRALVFDKNPVTTVQFRVDSSATWHSMTAVPGNSKLWSAQWDASALSHGNHTLEVRASSSSGTGNDVITVTVEQEAPPSTVGAASILLGEYVTTGTKKNKVTTFVEASGPFDQGDSIGFRMRVLADGEPVSGATVGISITGPVSIMLTTAPSNAAGDAEAVWNTSAPNKRGNGGTPTGDYSATIDGISAAGHVWDEVPAQVEFTINGISTTRKQ